MRAGEFPDGAHVLRAKIDMASPEHEDARPAAVPHPARAPLPHGRPWCIYPLYDFAHPLEDAIEGITHSICTLEFENNRELYDWVVENAELGTRPQQYEFARLNLDYTVMSKRKLLQLVEGGHVNGWDDPRMPTIAGLRRRGVTPEAIRAFCEHDRRREGGQPRRHRQARVRDPRRPEHARAARAVRAASRCAS